MDITTTISLVKEVGFPVFMCVWLMARTDKRMDRVISLLEAMASKGNTHA
jgi:hypothetical protein